MRKKLWLLVLIWPCGPLHAEPGTVTYVYTDPQGTPLAEADANGNITATFDYRPYGTQVLGQPPLGPSYTGHVNDPDTGLVYMQARYYDPQLGRFLSIDPATPSAGNLVYFNRYSYVGNNPITRIDPSGRYMCNGNTYDCESVAISMSEIKTAAANLPAGSDGQKALNQVLSFYGKEGSKNGVTINFAKIDGTALANTSTTKSGLFSKGSAKITLDMAKISSLRERHDGSTQAAESAARIAHEGVHGLTGMSKDVPRTTSRALEFEDERKAYSSQGYVNQGLNINSAYNIWRQGQSGLDTNAIDMSANSSTNLWCAQSQADGC